MSNIDKRALREAAEKHGDDDILALLDELEAETSYLEGALIACNRWHDKFRESEAKLEAAGKRIAELEKSHAQVIQGRDHYKRMCDEGFRRINKGINLSINGEG
ncbi:hypothetical protein [Enterobacter hormaechei]|uniref:hypothetical protein n=1 Tax=Enterobacter hormaechei TaxID=158836 RepID=UPI003D6D28E1